MSDPPAGWPVGAGRPCCLASGAAEAPGGTRSTNAEPPPSSTQPSPTAAERDLAAMKQAARDRGLPDLRPAAAAGRRPACRTW